MPLPKRTNSSWNPAIVPPGDPIPGAAPDDVKVHLHRLCDLGLLERRRVQLRNHADFIAYDPTNQARQWFDVARDDGQWEIESELLMAHLTTTASRLPRIVR
jgi:hypothetical protein